MTDHGPSSDPHETEAEALLRRARPLPSDEVVARMERRLLGRPQRRFAFSRPLGAGLVAAAGAAAALLVFSLAGSGPLGGDQQVEAGSRCHYVSVTREVRQPVVVHGADGQARIAYRPRAERKLVKRCD